jgi:ferrous iron transport protein B
LTLPFGIIYFVGKIAAPVVTRVLGLSQETVGALIIDFLRKNVAVGMLIPLGLTRIQLIVASVILVMYFPCGATFTTLIKELEVVDVLKSTGIMIIPSLVVGGLLNLILPGLKTGQ